MLAAVVVSLASLHLRTLPPFSQITVCPQPQLSFIVTPLCSRKGKLMAHTFARSSQSRPHSLFLHLRSGSIGPLVFCFQSRAVLGECFRGVHCLVFR
ncbi:hypothetical protein ACFX14_004168 [Malus domestica]